MIRYKEIAFAAYPVTDVARARRFYEGVLGFKPNAPLKSETQEWIEYDVGNGTLGIGCSERWKPSQDGLRSRLRSRTSTQRLRLFASTTFRLSSAQWTCHLATWRPSVIQTETRSLFIDEKHFPDSERLNKIAFRRLRGEVGAFAVLFRQ